MRRYAVIMGEALVDLLETHIGGERVFRPTVGGAPLNVAVGIVRLGGEAELLGSVGGDAFGRSIRSYLRECGVGDRGLVDVAAQTTLAVTTFVEAEPSFSFYGSPRSYGLLRPEALNPGSIAAAGLLYTGSIALLCEQALAAARMAWAIAGPVRVFDPNVRPALGGDLAELRRVVEEFAATADLVKLSAADAEALYGAGPRTVAERLSRLGAGAVVVTMGEQGALVRHDGQTAIVAGVEVRAVDATGAGDAVMAAMSTGILDEGCPQDMAGWVRLATDAMYVAGAVCEASGAATAMPTREQIRRRFPGHRW